MDKDRRRHLRKVPESFAFLQIEREEVGKVLNLSESGLCFSSFAPVPQDGPLYLWFSLNLKDRIEAMGEVAWTDMSRKIGGLRFVQMSSSARRQIQKWLAQPPARPSRGDEKRIASPTPQKNDPLRMPASKPDRVARFIAKARSRPPAFAKPMLSLDLAEPEVPRDPEPARKLAPNEPMSELVPLQRHRSAKRQQFVRGMLLGLIISAVATASSLSYWNYRHRASNPAAAHAPAPVPQNAGTQSLPSSVASESVRNAPSARIFSDNKQTSSTTVQTSPGKPLSASYATPYPRASAPKNPEPPLRTSAAAPFGESRSTTKRPLTPAELWSAVQAGNTKAAVELADLYIKGEGVAKNCQQARVLLLMASEKKNPTAIKRLQELDKDPVTCP